MLKSLQGAIDAYRSTAPTGTFKVQEDIGTFKKVVVLSQVGGVDFSHIIFDNEVHPENALLSMFFVDLPIVILVRLEQSANVHHPIYTVELGIQIFVKLEQSKNK